MATTAEPSPIPPNNGLTRFQTPKEPVLIFCPIPSSNSSNGIPSSNIIIKNGMTKAPPPFFWHRYGNLQIFPKPTQKPKIVIKNCIGLSHCTRSSSNSCSVTFDEFWGGVICTLMFGWLLADRLLNFWIKSNIFKSWWSYKTKAEKFHTTLF